MGSVLCVGDDPDAAGALAESLRRLGCVVHLASDAESGLKTILAQGPDLILCHSSMPGMSGLELLQKLAHSGSDYARAPIIVVTSGHDRDNELAARRLGADDCLTMPIDQEMLGAIVDNRLRRKAKGPSSSGRPPLTEREKDVLIWAARGKTSGEIATILGVSERTVNFHCEQAMKRLDVINRTQAVAQAIGLRLIPI
ncbi:MAG TPA: response regulator transcription factor [Beijerinckiaceae bacterium]|jgi:DNA-binding NarL/FixJ family response regulator|nr:response regulator transcription factor [Beijerinckiaceae bacterium]